MASDENYEVPETGAVFTFGRSGFADNQQSHFFIRNDPVVEISCGDEHTAVICQNGRVFLFGHNDYGQLGLGHTRTVTKPSCLKYLKPFHSTHVACGKGHTIVATKCGRLFSFGSNSDGQLGVGEFGDKTIPQLINTKRFSEDGIKAVSAGCFHSACLTSSGELYLWGSNADGQCGIDVEQNLIIPTKIEFESPIDSISCGYYHSAFIRLWFIEADLYTMFVLGEGNIYTFGEQENGKLGYKAKTSNLPLKLDLDFKCNAVKCGGNHTLMLSENGKVYACGSNFSGQLGISLNGGEYFLPTTVALPSHVNVIFMSAGESHSAFVTENGELYTCGDGRYGKTCTEDDTTNSTSPTLVTLFTHFHCAFVSCGGCQTMVLAKARSMSCDSDVSSPKMSSLPPLKVNKALNDSFIRDSLLSADRENKTEESAENIEDTTLEWKNAKSTEKYIYEDDVPQFDDIHLAMPGEESRDEHDVADLQLQTQIIANPTLNDIYKNAEPDVILGVEGKIKKLLNVFRKKKTNSAITSIAVKESPSLTERTDEIEEKSSDGKVGNQNKSRACTIL